MGPKILWRDGDGHGHRQDNPTRKAEGDTLGFSELTELRAFSLSHADGPGESPVHPKAHPGLAGDEW